MLHNPIQDDSSLVCLTPDGQSANITAVLKELLNGLYNLLFPSNCILCKKYFKGEGQESVLCQDCQSTIELNKPPFCQRCSRHLEEYADQSLCTECRSQHYHFDRAWGICRYNLSVRRLIHLFKYGEKTALRHTFSRIIATFIESYHVDIKDFNLIVPVPLHAARLRERGYNQSELLTDLLALRFKTPASKRNLIRIRHTQNQAHLGQKERWTNIQAAFKIKHSTEFLDKSVLVIDDLMTTGATASEAARTLKEAGAKKVSVLTLAIAP